MNKEQKTNEVKNLAERLEKAKTLIFAGYRGLKVSEITDLRMKLGKGQSSFKVVKNRLMKRALKEKGMGELAEYFTDPTAVASSDADPVTPAKVLVEFAKLNAKLAIKGGFLDGARLTLKDIETLAKMPSREVLLSKMLGSISAPATNMACVLIAVPRKLLYALTAIKATKNA